MSQDEEEIIIIGGGGTRPKSLGDIGDVYDQARAIIDAAEANGTPIRFKDK